MKNLKNGADAPKIIISKYYSSNIPLLRKKKYINYIKINGIVFDKLVDLPKGDDGGEGWW